MSNLYQSTYRCYLIDHHSPQPPGVTLDKLDIREYERFLEISNVDSQMVYCKDHWGVTYYPSQVPGAQMHKGLKGDWIAQVKQMLSKKGIELIAYYCIEYDEGAARAFPEWRVRKADGTPLIRNDEYAKWSLCCYQTGYRQYCLSQLAEIVGSYRPDALFLDIFGASLCYCPTCRAKFEARFGYALPETPEGLLEKRADVLAFLNENAAEFMDDLQATVKAIDPSLAVTVNFACHYPAMVRDKLDYQFSEPLLGDNWYSAAYARDTAIGQYPILAPGEASQVYNYDTTEQYIADLSCIAAQGCRVGMYSGSQHVDGTLDFTEAHRLGAVYRQLEKMHPWLTGRTPIGSVGILQSDASAGAKISRLEPDAILRAKIHNPHIHAILGAMMLCENAKLPWQVLPVQGLTEQSLKKCDLLLLPEVFVLSDETVALLEDYVRAGGTLLLSQEAGLYTPDGQLRDAYALEQLMGARFVAQHHEYAANHWSAYVTPAEHFSPKGLLAATTPPVGDCFTELKPQGAQTLLHFITPCLAVTEQSWVNWWSPPPGAVTEMPALIHHHTGDGSVFTCAFDLFTMAASGKFHWLDELFGEILRVGEVNPAIVNQVAHPHMVRTAFFAREGEVLVHQISHLPHIFGGEHVPVSGGCLCVDLERLPFTQAQVVYPMQSPLDVRVEGTTAYVTLPDIDIQQIISLTE